MMCDATENGAENQTESKEELLQRLADAAAELRRTEEIRLRLEELRGQYRTPPVPGKKAGKGTKALLLICILLCLAPLAEHNIAGVVLLAIETAGVCCVLMLLAAVKDQKTDRKNREVRLWNEQQKAQERELSEELERAKTACRDHLKPWFPQAYCSVKAAEFFYDAVKSGRADSLNEAVRLYESGGMWEK